MEYFLVVDVGGTFLKGLVYEAGSKNCESISRVALSPIKAQSDGGQVIDPSENVEAVLTLLRRITPSNGRCIGIGVTGQMHGVVVVDDLYEAKTPIYTWRSNIARMSDPDIRVTIEELQNDLGSEVIKELGNELRTGIPLQTLTGLNRSGRLGHSNCVLSLISFVALSLSTKSRVNLIHSSDAAAFGLFDVRSNSWHDTAIKVLGLQNLNFPDVTSRIESVGWSTEFDCPVYVAIGDHQTNLAGVELGHNEVSINLATGGQVSRIAQVPSPAMQTRPYFDGQFLHTVTHIPAGRSLNVLVSLFSYFHCGSTDDLWDRIQEATAIRSETSLIVDNSFFESPFGSRGSISNITEDNFSVGDLFRAACNSIGKKVHESLTLIDPDRNADIVLSGGALTRFLPLKEAIIDRLRSRHVRLLEGDDASLRGLCLLLDQYVFD